MRSPYDDRTARARIRDEALRLFAERGTDVVTVRDIAAAAGVSPALILRHYTSKEGLREAIDEHVTATFEMMLDGALHPADAGPFDQAALSGLAELIVQYLPEESPLPAYLGRMLLGGGDAGSALFRRLYAVSRDALGGLVAAGSADSGVDPDVRAAFLLVNDLAVLTLRQQLGEVLGFDPLSAAGMKRWGAEVLAVYRSGLGGDAAQT